MRKVLLVLLMVAASFAGGAAINGPGLDWARDRFHDYLAELFGTPIEPSPASPKPAIAQADDDPAMPIAPVPDLVIGGAPTVRHEAERPAAAVSTATPDEEPAPLPLPVPAAEPPPARQVARTSDPSVARTALPTDASTGATDPGSWAAVRRRMQDLGVKQYWVEGQPGGLVRFRCVIPLAGKNAMAQHFEAEAADEFRAAEAALRRVVLWKATETP
ncbi:MAG: hypothetical protein U0800_20300 [Isosphaeraceae bacterium]